MEKNNQPLVSIVIPCYNHEQFVQDCIQSVIDQTYENIELIIIDDGSKDNSVLKIQEMVLLCKERFTRFEFRNRANKGLSATLNEALEWCEGKYYSVIASDDKLLKSKSEIQVRFLEKNPDCVAVFGGISIIDQNGNIIRNRVLKERYYNFNQIFMLKHDLPAPTQMIRLNILKKVGGYNTKIRLEDWYMLLLIANKGKICYLSQLLSQYRYHDSNTFNQIDLMYNARIKVLDFHKEHSLYSKALLKIEWLNACELNLEEKNEAIKKMVRIVKRNPTQIFSFELLQFFYWFIFKSRIKR